ncbi:hypothetical protein GCM10012279_02810 [Micromonospora yangpuensis]|nr:hypothetical protein GCM10012279_02810 [Micromonospora yangpuensis]
MLSYPAAIPLSNRTLNRLHGHAMSFVLSRVVGLVGDSVDGDEGAVEDGVGQSCWPCGAGVEVVGEGGEQVDRLADVPPGGGGADGEAGGEAEVGVAVAQVRQDQQRLPSGVQTSPSASAADADHVRQAVVTDPAGGLVWASSALPGAVHDLTAARTVGLVDALTSSDVMTFADKGYQGAGGTIRTPFKRHRHRPRLSRRQKAVNEATPVSERSASVPSPPSRAGRS